MNSDLELAQQNHVSRLRTALSVIRSELSPPGHVMACASYRVLGACALLLDSDTPAYRSNLGSSARTRLDFLEQAHQSNDVEDRYLCASKDLGFACAAAIADWDTATEIARRSKDAHCPDVEYEDDFLFFRFMHRLLLDRDDTATTAAILERWSEVLEGADSGHFDVCASIHERDAGKYAAGFEALLDSRAAQLDKYARQVSADAELLAVERGLFVEGAAVARLAKLCGLPTPGEHKMVPKAALR